jgi:hypothetical protein
MDYITIVCTDGDGDETFKQRFPLVGGNITVQLGKIHFVSFSRIDVITEMDEYKPQLSFDEVPGRYPGKMARDDVTETGSWASDQKTKDLARKQDK